MLSSLGLLLFTWCSYFVYSWDSYNDTITRRSNENERYQFALFFKLVNRYSEVLHYLDKEVHGSIRLEGTYKGSYF
jgi:hypothetical protein